MKIPARRRPNPKHRKLGPPPPGVDLAAVAGVARYTGSAYHKDMPSFAGPAPRPRPNASICPRDLAHDADAITQWLRDAIRAGHFSSLWERGYPRYVWVRRQDVVFEGRLTNAGTGEYHGYPLEPFEEVEGLP